MLDNLHIRFETRYCNEIYFEILLTERKDNDIFKKSKRLHIFELLAFLKLDKLNLKVLSLVAILYLDRLKIIV